MNIGYIYEMTAYPPRGGNHRHAYELVQEFHRQGHRVLVVDDATMPNATNFSLEDIDSFLAAIDVLYMRIDGRFTLNSPATNKSLERSNTPVVWEINAPANEGLAFSWLGGKVSDETESIVKTARRWLHAKRQAYRINKEEKHRANLARKVDAAICVSDSLRRYANQQLAVENALVLPNGGPLISEEEIQKRRRQRGSEQFTVFYSGSAIYPWQGMQYIFDTVRLAEKQAPDIKFVLAVNQRTPYLPASKNVEIREALDKDGVLDAICQSDVCVALHPEYNWSPWGFHNSPMKLFEYMACMTASLSSNIGQMKALINHGEDGLLCNNHPRDILASIKQLQTNGALRRKVAENGWKRVQRELNWRENVKATLGVFDKLRAR